MYFFLGGAIMMACGIVSFFFLRFWRKTSDRLFLIFSLAFAILGIERLVLAAFYTAPNEAHPLIYCIRLLAFVLIIVAIVDKNRSSSRT